MILGELNSAWQLFERLRKLWSPKEAPESVATRFVRLFESHGVHRNQIARLLKQPLSIGELKDDAELLGALRTEHLDEASMLFGVRREWLEGASMRIYDTRWCYKSPEMLLETLAKLGSPATIAPLRAVATNLPLGNRDRGNRIELIAVETAGWLGELEVLRFIPFSDGFEWTYGECRLQLKAMIRSYGKPVPLFGVSATDIDALYAGEIFPAQLLRGSLCSNPSLEDYCMRRDEHRGAKEVEELGSVYGYMHEHDLDTRWGGSGIRELWRRLPNSEVGPG